MTVREWFEEYNQTCFTAGELNALNRQPGSGHVWITPRCTQIVSSLQGYGAEFPPGR